MPWPEKVLRQFRTILANPAEREFHGPYNKLLYTIFPADSDFTVVPQYLEHNSLKKYDFIFTFEVSIDNKPVLIIR